MTHAPALGERAALRGYRWQYDHTAELVYDALVDGDFEELRLTDPTAGQVEAKRGQRQVAITPCTRAEAQHLADEELEADAERRAREQEQRL